MVTPVSPRFASSARRFCIVVIAVAAAACSGAGDVTSVDGQQRGNDTTTPQPSNAPNPPTTPNPTGAPDPTQPTTTAAVPQAAAGVIDWQADSPGIETGTLQVPLDYSNPTGASIQLYLVRHLASDTGQRIGSLLVNPGGPGYGGSWLAENADGIYGADLLQRFDIVGWDPRGTGLSEPAINCVDDYDPYFSLDSSPDDDAERTALVDAATRFADQCTQANGKLMPFVDTVNSARDIDSIRRSLGEDTISYFGFSYGSELGATWATLYPTTVRAAVIDGAVDPTVGYLQQNLQQAAGFEATFSTFLKQCSSTVTCPFYNNGNAEEAFDALAIAIDSQPLVVDGRPPATQGVLFTAVTNAMYSEQSWSSLEAALADAQVGDGAGIYSLYDEYYGMVDGAPTDDGYEAYFAIGCSDDPGSSSPADLLSHEDEFAAAAPRLGRSWLAELTFCSVWPIKPGPPIDITGAGAGQIVVVGTTGDAATPLESTRAMARALENGRLIVVTADQHTGYGVNDCVDSAVDSYLIDPVAVLPTELACP